MFNMMLGGDMRVVVRSHRDRLALGRQSSMPLIKWICVVFIEFIRGVPLITLLFVASVMLAYLFPPDATLDLFIRVVIMITHVLVGLYCRGDPWRSRSFAKGAV